MERSFKGGIMKDEMGFESAYGGVEPVEVGSLEDVKEIRLVIPPTKAVEVMVRKAENAFNSDNTYRQIALQLQLTKGIGEEGKYKNKIVFSRVCYYADPNKYDKDFFKNRQHLVQLKYLGNATSIDLSKIDGETIDSLKGKVMLCDVTTKKNNVTGDLDNEGRNYKAVSLEEAI